MAAQLTYAGYLTTDQRFIPVIGRLKPGTSVESANAEIAAVAAGFDRPAEDAAATFGAAVVPLAEVRVDPVLRRSAFLLLAAAACVLLITCVNVASLLLARARTRRREMAVRIALGSSRLQIARLVLIEELLLVSATAMLRALKLAAAGAGLGVAAAVASGRLLQSVVVGDVRIGVPILAGAVITMFAAAALAAYWPARRATKVEPWVVLRD